MIGQIEEKLKSDKQPKQGKRKERKNRFMQVDKNGDIFSNFYSNFISQFRNPRLIPFFGAMKIIKENKQKNQNNMETTQTAETTEYRYDPEQIDWKMMSELNLSKEKLEKLQLLDPLLKGFKTNELVSVNINLGKAFTRMDARLSFQPGEDGKPVLAIHGIRREPTLHFPFLGHEFSQEDKDNLLKSGNMGRIVELTNPKTNEKTPSIISLDRLTNELVALRADWIKIPEEIKGVKLNEEQRQTLMEGKPLYIEGMISKKGESFDAEVQFNADKRYVEFLFGDRTSVNLELKVNQSQEQTISDSEKSKKTEQKVTENKKQEKPKTPAKAKGRKV